MNRKRIVYLELLLILTIIISVSYFSYAFYTTKIEEHGKLNIVVGTLDYKLESMYLRDNKIEVDRSSSLEFIITVTSLNSISSNYEMYYKLNKDIEDVEVGFSSETEDSVKNVIGANETKEIKVVIKNYSDEKVIITFGVHGGFTHAEYDNISSIGSELNEVNLDDVILVWNYTGTGQRPIKFPGKNDGYWVNSVECNGLAAEFDNFKWQLSIPEINKKVIACNFDITDRVTMTSANQLTMGDAVTAIDGTEWHVLETSNSGVNTVVLFSDYNITGSLKQDTNCGAFVYWTGTYSVQCSVRVFDTRSDVNTIDETSGYNIGYFIKNKYEPHVTNLLPGTTNVTMPTFQQLFALGGTVTGENVMTLDYTNYPWLRSTSYWTKTPYSGSMGNSGLVWVVDGQVAQIYPVNVNIAHAGFRPVITTPKTNLIGN